MTVKKFTSVEEIAELAVHRCKTGLYNVRLIAAKKNGATEPEKDAQIFAAVLDDQGIRQVFARSVVELVDELHSGLTLDMPKSLMVAGNYVDMHLDAFIETTETCLEQNITSTVAVDALAASNKSLATASFIANRQGLDLSIAQMADIMPVLHESTLIRTMQGFQ